MPGGSHFFAACRASDMQDATSQVVGTGLKDCEPIAWLSPLPVLFASSSL